MKLLAKITGDLQFFFLSWTVSTIRVLHYRAAISIGRFLGILAWTCVPLHRRIAHIQIRYALGEVNEKRMTLKMFIHQGEIIIDAIKYAYMDDAEIREKVVIEGWENMEAALATGRGIVGIAGHTNWEVLAQIPRICGIELSVMADVIKNPRIQSIVEDMRSRYGFTLLPPKGGMVSKLTDELRGGRIIGIAVDQRGRRENRVFCDVFGMPAPTSPVPALIALRGDAIIQPVWGIKRGDTYILRFDKTIDSRDFGDDYLQVEKLRDAWQSRAVQELSQAMQSWMESVIKACGYQYFWLHTRWLRRSDMKRILKTGADFREYVYEQTRDYLRE
jgi:KDO2-lipid IV(A) lauroyltransferase